MSAVAKSTAAVRATTSRSLRLREGSTTRMLALARVPLARPWRQDQEDARVARSAHLVALFRVEVRDEAGPARDRGPVLLELDLAGGDDHPRPLVDLVLLELLARRKVDCDRTRLRIAPQHLRLMR